jgi:hypothetical protein
MTTKQKETTMPYRIRIIGGVLLALLAFAALFPPGPTAPQARAQEAPTPAAQGGRTIFLPLVTGGSAPDLVFDPPALELAPGEEASTIVRVDPPTDLSGASFQLDSAPDGATSSFAPAAAGLTGTLTLTAAANAPEREQSLTVLGRSGEKTWVGSLKLTVVSTTAKTFFVDPVKGNDANAGTQSKPFKTLAKALSKAKQGDTIILGKGVYSSTSNGEKYTSNSQQVLVPSGVTIQGTLEGQQRVSVLQGEPGAIGLNFAGDATVKSIALSGFNVGIQAIQGRQSLNNLFMTQNVDSLDVRGSAQATLVGSTINLIAGATGVSLDGQAQFTMDGGRITRGGTNCDFSIGVRAIDSTQVTLKNNATLEDIAGTALSLADTTKTTLTNAAINRTLPSGCSAQPSVRLFDTAALTLQRSQVTNSGGKDTIGISMNDGTPRTLTLIGSTVSGFKGSNSGTGIDLADNAKLTVSNGSRLLANTVGINARGRLKVDITVTDSDLSVNNVGIYASSFKVRHSSLVNNGVAVAVSSVNTFALVDLGQNGDPGNNVIQNSTIAGVGFDSNITLGGAFARGNTWNANTQGADGNGHYPDGLTINGFSPLAHGKNFDLQNHNLAIEL